MEERVGIRGEDVVLSPDGDVPTWAQEFPRSPILHGRISPVPSGRGEDQVVAGAGRRHECPRLKIGGDHINIAKAGQIGPDLLREVGPKLDDGDPEPTPRERQCRL